MRPDEKLRALADEIETHIDQLEDRADDIDEAVNECERLGKVFDSVFGTAQRIIAEAEHAHRSGETQQFVEELIGLDSPLKKMERECLAI